MGKKQEKEISLDDLEHELIDKEEKDKKAETDEEVEEIEEIEEFSLEEVSEQADIEELFEAEELDREAPEVEEAPPEEEIIDERIYIIPLKKVTFHNSNFLIPNNVEKFLEQMYGSNWGTPIKEYPSIITDENCHIFKTRFKKNLVFCPKCKNGHIIDSPHKYGDGKGCVLPVNIKCKKCGNKWEEDVFIRGVILKKVYF